MSSDANSSLLLGEWVHALARWRLSPCTVEQHRLEHRSVHLDLLNQAHRTWRTGVLPNRRFERLDSEISSFLRFKLQLWDLDRHFHDVDL